ncbi:hypothetical protein F4780DRAFT_753627 [Xylariomycetidae sp. FL0641]|nr:hypothetical protein F4780DRAFT_753627 [Xylariomycetidae sp. FL0641]
MASIASKAARFSLVFHVPTSAAASCKSAIFAAGAGRQGNYSECCWTATGVGQFRPAHGANPAIGKVGSKEEVEEARVETRKSRPQITLVYSWQGLTLYVRYSVRGRRHRQEGRGSLEKVR